MAGLISKFQKLPFSEWILVQQVKIGDKEAFGALYQLYLAKIYRFIFFKVGQNVQLAEDLTEVTFIKAWEKISLYKKTGGSFSSWLYTIARNTVIDHYRSVKKNISLQEDHTETTQNVEEAMFKALEIERIQDAMQYLTDEQREIITLKFINDMSNKEISIMLGKKEDAIRAMQHRAIEELRKRLT